EAFNFNQEEYGLNRLCEVVSQNWQLSAEKIKQTVIADVRRHIGNQKVFDDITLVVLKQK
ncbi:MAG: SpoIIE family protein phosphatase, partial [Coleofasciculaceae cyanobacterium]